MDGREWDEIEPHGRLYIGAGSADRSHADAGGDDIWHRLPPHGPRVHTNVAAVSIRVNLVVLILY